MSIEVRTDDAVRYERAVLGCLIESPELWPQASSLDLNDFLLSDNRALWQAICRLNNDGEPVDIVHLDAATLGKVDIGYIARLVDGCVPENFKSYVRHLLRAVQNRRFERLKEGLNNGPSEDERLKILLEMIDLLRANPTGRAICSYEDIPDLFQMEIEPLQYIVADLIGRATVNLVTGEPGVGKTFLFLKLAVSVALGSEFLGRPCTRTKVLALDRENPARLIQKRLSLIAGGPIPNLRIWGGWAPEPPPLIGDARLLRMAETEGPFLVILDSLLRFHDCKENEASEMRVPMGHLRRLADSGNTVIVVHHRTKTQDLYRGSSDILAAVDAAYSLERDGDGLKLVAFKSRDSELKTFGIRADFAKGQFEASETSSVLERRDNVEVLRKIIAAQPGVTQNEIARVAGFRRPDVISILKREAGKLWQRTTEGKAIRHYPTALIRDKQLEIRTEKPAVES